MMVKRRGNTQLGVSMVEFALICLLFFATIGFFIELSIAYFNYQLLVSATTTTARKVGVFANLSVNSDTCTEVEDNSNSEGAAQRARKFLETSFGISNSYFVPVRFCADIMRDASDRCYVRIRGKWPFKCFFCLFYKGGAVLNAEGEAYIEDECLPCSNTNPCTNARTDTSSATSPGVNCVSGSYSDQVAG